MKWSLPYSCLGPCGPVSVIIAAKMDSTLQTPVTYVKRYEVFFILGETIPTWQVTKAPQNLKQWEVRIQVIASRTHLEA